MLESNCHWLVYVTSTSKLPLISLWNFHQQILWLQFFEWTNVSKDRWESFSYEKWWSIREITIAITVIASNYKKRAKISVYNVMLSG